MSSARTRTAAAVVGGIVMPDVIESADVRMLKRRYCFGFSLEPRFQFAISATENLDRNRAVESRIACFVDLTHAACTKGGENFVGAEASAGTQRHEAFTVPFRPSALRSRPDP